MDLIDISGEKMEHVMAAPVDPEPHYAQMIKADKLNPIRYYEKDENRENSGWNQEDARVERNGNEVDVYRITFRSRFVLDSQSERPDVIEVNEGDTVRIHRSEERRVG